ncbi:ferric reductase-like protein [Psychrobacter frigidicola]|uniref:Ferric reductase-like protein n=1 Tax=Psychrobacter frigidicola TaxID=45611 RepID=A0A5C7A7Z2_9GAMM|nr:ferric reductase-like protein [Psychrobacter frigidicola]TXD97826.1 ferric reductase-like protein [Psychrobacter frigidicola]
MNIDNPTSSHTTSNTTLITQVLWIGLILSMAISIGGYALLTWGETASQLLTSTDKHFWYLSRASGVIAYTLFWLAVVFGLLLSTRLGKHFNAARVFALHEYLSLLAVGFAAFHAGILLADNFLNLNLWQILLPFGFQTERVGVALGQLGFWLLFICAFSFYIKKYIGQSAWRWLHFLTFTAYMFISIHVFMVGSDSRALPLLLFYAGSQTVVFLLMTYRLVALKQAK